MCGINLRRGLALSLFCSVTWGCGWVENWVQTDLQMLPAQAIPSTKLEGQVDEFVVTTGASAQAACEELKVYLFDLDDSGRKLEPALASVDAVDGVFEFSDLDLNLGLTNLGANKPLLLQAYGCNKLYSRIVTGAFEQRLNLASHVLASLLNSSLAIKTIENLKKDSAKACGVLIEALESTSTSAQMLTKLNTTLSSQFEKLAGIDADANLLKLSFPAYLIKAIPASLEEEQSAVFEIATTHWSSAYGARVEWRDSGGLLSTNPYFAYTPNKNSQSANKTFTLVLGASNGGTVDNGKPKFQVTFDLEVVDQFPVSVPPVTLSSGATSRSSKVLLSMVTGTALQNCQTFSKLAISLNQTTAPNPSAFDSSGLSCSTENVQVITYNLPNTSSGAKAIRLWTMDSDGNISPTPALVNMTFDPNAPILAFQTPAPNTNFLTGTEITGTCELGFNVVVSGSGVNAQQIVPCESPGTFTAQIQFAAGDGAKTIDLMQVYADGSATTATRQLVLDTSPPILTLDSPADNTSAATGVTITGDCETGLDVNITGGGVASPNMTTCVASRYSQAILFTAGVGEKVIYVDQTDLAGNITSVMRKFNRTSP